MRKIAIALGAIAFALGTSVIVAEAATKTTKDGAVAGQPVKVKKVVKKKAPSTVVKYKAKCKAGHKWDATASLSSGACVKIGKVKVKTKAAAKPAAGKVG